MTLSIKALEPKPETAERKPRAQKADGEEKARKPRAPKVEEEVTEWSEDNQGGVSIADLLNKNA
jgi:predicted RNA-binding protein with RPS1 domain